MLLRGRYRLHRCDACRTQFLRATDGSSEASEYWSDPYKFELYSDEAVRRDFDGRYRRVFDHVERLLGPVRSVVDIGCGVGNFLDYAGRRGWDARGFDIDHDAVKWAHARGLLASADAKDFDRLAPNGSADVGTLWDVIEHLQEPQPLLRQVIAKIRPGGALVIETPDANFPLRPIVRGLREVSGGRVKLAGRMYYWEHKVYFTVDGLRRVLSDVGCEVVSVAHENSPRVKMSRLWSRSAKGGRVASKLMVRAWPLLDRSTRLLDVGNKIILVARVPGLPTSHEDAAWGT
jgi:2-polyprenyl-3-methyl-5-hydroxy-6-metoxy-1,4-benzoquinol methylase